LSPELGKTLKTLLESQRPLLEIVRTLIPSSPGVTINNQQNNVESQTNIQAIGTEEALSLIEKQKVPDLLGSPEMKLELGTELQSQELPEVVATRQKGFRLDAEATLALKPEIKPTAQAHLSRREEDGEILD
jgi:hypothetical protein